VTKEKGQDAKGRPITRVFLDVAGKKYEAVGKQAQGKLAPVNGKMAKVTCYLDGDENCLQIAEISEVTPMETSGDK
ncbi:MAG: hypothetical protein RBU25_17860, partial [Lentisphaeria bacterium]|jgi:hypothetical protein|nr:hypothetical protein [Lentisphaeria bacterium]